MQYQLQFLCMNILADYFCPGSDIDGGPEKAVQNIPWY